MGRRRIAATVVLDLKTGPGREAAGRCAMKGDAMRGGRLLSLLTMVGLMLLMAAPLRAETRLALVVGNSAYKHTPVLDNPLNDARDIAGALERTGFEVIVAVDADKRQMDGALRAFAEKLARADVALFFYAGHGLQVGNENWLLPVDAKLGSQRDLEFEAVRLDFVLRQMEIDRDGKTTIVMLDACRDNPLSRSLARTMGTRSASIGTGLAPASTGVGTFIAYATQPGNVALDGKGRNSPFTAALLANVGQRGRNLNATMIEVRKAVIAATDGRQVPWDHSALTGDFYFVPGEVQVGKQTAAPAGKSDDVEALKSRLKALEEAEKRREATATGERGSQAKAGAVDAETIAQLAEARARLAVAEDQAKSLQMQLLEARRVEGQARDPAEKQRLQQASIKLQMDMTKAGQTAKRLRDQIAALAPAPAQSPPRAEAAPAAPSQQVPTTVARAFNVRLGLRAAGAELAAPPSTANCESRCRSEARCLAYNLSREGICELLSEVTRTVSATNWRTGERPCLTMGLGFADPIEIAVGAKLCNGIGQNEAVVDRITERAVAFSVKGGREFTCTPDDVCQFDWPGAPSPYFRVVIDEAGAGQAARARMVPR